VQTLTIGDLITDLNIAMAVTVVFARDLLCHYLDEANRSYIAWNDFHDVRIALAKRWG
jgi:2-hydroxy-3-keto-5-methylthiopentenyl-1-phosphate phosphatase